MSDLEDIYKQRPELGHKVMDIYEMIYRLGGRIPTFEDLDRLAKLIDNAVLEIDGIELGAASEMLADFHTVICRWTIRATKQDIIKSLKESTPGDGMGSILLMDATYNYSMTIAQRERKIDFLLDLMNVCKWKTALETIKRMIAQLSEDKA